MMCSEQYEIHPSISINFIGVYQPGFCQDAETGKQPPQLLAFAICAITTMIF